MSLEELIEREYPFLEFGADTEVANSLFEKIQENVLPVLEDGVFKGVLLRSQADLWKGDKVKISEIKDQLKPIYIEEEGKVIQAMEKVTSEELTSLSVVDEDGRMIGILKTPKLWSEYARISNLLGPGGWVVLSMKTSDFQLSEIAQIVESNNMMIISQYIQFYSSSQYLDIHLKLNKENVNELVQTFQRYKYNVIEVIQPKRFEDDWDDRFDQLMRYFST